jgi:hypothetical protein
MSYLDTRKRSTEEIVLGRKVACMGMSRAFRALIGQPERKICFGD